MTELNDKDTLLEKNANYKEAIKEAYEESKNENIPLLFTGSFYLAAAAKAIIGTNKS